MPGHCYTIRVAGGLGATALSAFPEFASHVDGSVTTLTGELPDSAALYGAVARLEALGLDLIDVHRLDDHADRAATSHPPRMDARHMTMIDSDTP